MLNLLLVLAISALGIFLLTKYILEKQKKAALEDLYKEYHQIREKFQELPGELQEILAEMFRTIKFTSGEIELKYSTYKESSDVFEFVNLKKAQAKEFTRQITDNKQKWEIYDNFLENVGEIKLKIENLQKDINKRIQDIKISFGEKTEEELEKDNLLDKESQRVISDLEMLYREYDNMQSVSYMNFESYKLRDLESLKESLMQEAIHYFNLLNAYNKRIEIYLVELSRRSIFYLKIKELLEGYQSGKNKMANLGEVEVSYSTYESMQEGSRYRKDVYVTSKRIAQDIKAIFKITNGKKEFYHEGDLSYDELLDLLHLTNLKPSGEEDDEHNIAYNFEISNFEVLLGQKDKQELLIHFAKNLELLHKIPINN